jgi:hypothetical protein
LISISDSNEGKQKDNLQQHKKLPSQQQEPTHEQTLEKVHILNKKPNKRRIQQAMVINL